MGNFVFAETGEDDARPLFEALLREGVIVRPTAGFGAPGAIRVTVGTEDENAFFAEALARVNVVPSRLLSRGWIRPVCTCGPRSTSTARNRAGRVGSALLAWPAWS